MTFSNLTSYLNNQVCLIYQENQECLKMSEKFPIDRKINKFFKNLFAVQPPVESKVLLNFPPSQNLEPKAT